MSNLAPIIEVASLIASIASLILAVVAIWIALYTKRESDRINQSTRGILTDIKSDAKTVANVAMPELKAYGDSMRKFVLHSRLPSEPTREIDTMQIISESMSHVESEIAGLRQETDLSKLKDRIADIEEHFKASERTVKKVVKATQYRGIGIRLEGGPYVTTSSPNETWQDLLAFSLTCRKGLTRDNYGKIWTLIISRTGNLVPRGLVLRKTSTFKDLEVHEGDELILSLMKHNANDK